MRSGNRVSFSVTRLTILAIAAVVVGGVARNHLAHAYDASAKKKDAVKKSSTDKDKSKMPALQFKMKDIDGNLQNLTQYHGNVILMVNVASACGLTPQYTALQEIYEKNKDKGFVVLGFPANEFGKQEPGSDSEIKDFCSKNFKVTFPMFSKIVVKGEGIHPLFEYLTSKDAGHDFGGEIAWNFNKFLIDRDGRVVARFEPRVAPDAEKLTEALEKELAKPIPEGSQLAKQMKQATTEQPEKKPARRGH